MRVDVRKALYMGRRRAEHAKLLASFVPGAVWQAGRLFRLLGVHVLLEEDAELLPQRLELGEVLLVLALVLSLGLDALENADGGGVVVDPPGSLDGSLADGRRGDEIVGESVVQVALLWRSSVSLCPCNCLMKHSILLQNGCHNHSGSTSYSTSNSMGRIIPGTD